MGKNDGMARLRLAAGAVTGALAMAGASGATAADSPASPAAAPKPALATIIMSEQIDFTSAINGHTYRIQIAKPFAPAPKGGYPTLYVLDGDGYFGTWSSAVRMRGISQEIEPAVVVGVGYPDGDNSLMVAMSRRNYDLTQSPPDAETAASAPGFKGKDATADADTFFRVLEEEIKPRVARAIAVAPGRDILFGHSLGGLFVLHTLYKHPDAFHTWLALSPSVWWDDRSVLKDEPAFVDWVKKTHPELKLFVAVGRLEQVPPTADALPPGYTLEKMTAMVNRSAMVDNAQGVVTRLSAIDGGPGFHVDGKVFEGKTHISVAWESVNTFLDFALPLPKPSR